MDCNTSLVPLLPIWILHWAHEPGQNGQLPKPTGLAPPTPDWRRQCDRHHRGPCMTSLPHCRRDASYR